MYQWFQKLGIKKVKWLPDGNADFTRDVGMIVKKENLGFGDRSWRIVNGEFKKVFIEPGQTDNCEDDPYEVSDADTMIRYLKSEE
jgi:peroxiredoxin